MKCSFTPKFGKCNIVIVDSNPLSLDHVLGTPLRDFMVWETGCLAVYATAIPDTTLTTLPIPRGKINNFASQRSVLDCADAFILIVNTSANFCRPPCHWIETLKSFENIPVICWIDRTKEERTIAEFKEMRAKDLRKRYRAQTQLQALKDQNQVRDEQLSRELFSLYDFYRRFPVLDYWKLVDEIKTELGKDTQIMDFDPTGIPLLNWTDEPQLVAEKDRMRVRQLFEGCVRTFARFQEERGINQSVLENKQKNVKIVFRLLYCQDGVLDDEVDEPVNEQVDAQVNEQVNEQVDEQQVGEQVCQENTNNSHRKEKKGPGLVSRISKLFSFSSSKEKG